MSGFRRVQRFPGFAFRLVRSPRHLRPARRPTPPRPPSPQRRRRRRRLARLDQPFCSRHGFTPWQHRLLPFCPFGFLHNQTVGWPRTTTATATSTRTSITTTTVFWMQLPPMGRSSWTRGVWVLVNAVGQTLLHQLRFRELQINMYLVVWVESACRLYVDTTSLARCD